MQLKYKRDFFLRNATLSDQNEAVALVEKHQSAEASQKLCGNFAEMLKMSDSFFKVALNSNGVVIGVMFAAPEEFEILAVNPNFLKQEVKEVLFQELGEWAKGACGGKLKVAPRLVTGDWKTFVKHAGMKMENASGAEWILF